VKKREYAGGRKLKLLELLDSDLGKARHPLQDRGLDSTTGHGVDRPAAALSLESEGKMDQWVWRCTRRMKRAYNGEPNGGGGRSEQRHQGQSGRRPAVIGKIQTRFDNTREEEGRTRASAPGVGCARDPDARRPIEEGMQGMCKQCETYSSGHMHPLAL
jgi:hypothetical protein